MNIKEYKYKIDFHTHTSPVSPCSQITPQRMVEAYKELGFERLSSFYFQKP